MKRLILYMIVVFIAIMGIGSLTACEPAADVASRNISVAADNFEILRRIVFYNGITGDYILVIEGYCSLGNYDPAGELSVTCKTASDEYLKHFLGLSDNVTYFAEQMETANVDSYHYRVIFRPETILPDIEISTGE